MARLFISYKREEYPYAFAIRQWLIEEQDWPPHEIFVDVDINTGDEWAERIFREAEACAAMLFIASEASIQPGSFCYKELKSAGGLTIAVTIGGLAPDDVRLRDALPHNADARQITALDAQPTEAFPYVSPVDSEIRGFVALNRRQVESIGKTLRDLGIAPNSFTWKPTPDGPYRGLDPLQEGDEALFYGREREIRDCIRALEEIRQGVSARALLIQAPSGAGKSSLLRAGLWRRLRHHAAFTPLAIVRARQGALSHEEWGLAAGLAKPDANRLNLPLGAIEDRISEDLPGLLADFAKADPSQDGKRRTLLLGIDQAEELAALTTPKEIEELRRLFAAPLKAKKQKLDLRLVLTARDDSIDATLQQLATFAIPEDSVKTYRMSRMPPPRFKDIIEKPAAIANHAGFPLKFDEELTTALAQAATENQGEFSDALPILAVALRRIVLKRRAPDGTIAVEPMAAGRFVSEAVAEAAREAMASAGADELALRRLIIPRLVTWDPRAGEGGAAKRKIATGKELFKNDREQLKPLADALVNQRLLTRSGDNYEVSHEALLRVAPLDRFIGDLRDKFRRVDMLIMEAREWIESGRRKEWVARTGGRLKDSQALRGDADFGPMLSEPKLGIDPYIAACIEKDRDEQELRERLERSQLASIAAVSVGQQLREANTGDSRVSARPAGGAKIYISASRSDLAIAQRIADELARAGFDVVFDFMNVAPGENWKIRVDQMILEAERVLFLVSPDFVNSPVCNREVDRAFETGKTIVPVMVRETEFAAIPAKIASLNLLFMRDETEYRRDMPGLVSALSIDAGWIREHTRIGALAATWIEGGKNSAYLLRGAALEAAQRWLAIRPASGPGVTPLQLDFIAAGRQAQAKGQRRMALAASVASTLFLVLAVAASVQWFRADRERAIAEEARISADRERVLAETARQSAENQNKITQADAVGWRKRVDELQVDLDTMKSKLQTLTQPKTLEYQNVSREGTMREISATIADRPGAAGIYEIRFKWTGSGGTWSGRQTATVSFKAADGKTTLQVVQIPIDRSGCFYGGGKAQSKSGDLIVPAASIVSMTVELSEVQARSEGLC